MSTECSVVSVVTIRSSERRAVVDEQDAPVASGIGHRFALGRLQADLLAR